ncbi:MAG: DUF3179 domain-containing protein [Candidatus Acetothermia bacterium]|jgi:hypothetical protein|nr:DUF3179 domain-containing protein [Candidatus Acetothermia bacterium]MDH7504912.1 DUF3179 domain-containing protein [Candidatus Acetothermia bacterium]
MPRAKIIALALVLLAAGAVALLWRGGRERQVAYSPVEGAAPPEEIALGSLGPKYLTQAELKRLGLRLDLNQVKYLKGLDPRRWALACERGIDCLPELDPEFESVLEADQWLGEGDLVLSVRLGQQARAYPLRILAWHQVVNDSLGERPILVSYCPISGAGVAYERPLADGRPLTFGASGRLYNGNLLLYDRRTGSLWQQLTSEPVAGPLVGLVGRLKRLYTDIVPWGDWKRGHPGGEVLARPKAVRIGGKKAPISPEHYGEYPYAEYELRPLVGYGVEVERLELRRLAPKRRILGLEAGGRAQAYLRTDLARLGLLNDWLGEVPILAVMTPGGEARFFRRELAGSILEFRLEEGKLIDEGTGTSWSFDGRALAGPLASQGATLEELPAVSAYWFAWLLFHPESDLFSQ